MKNRLAVPKEGINVLSLFDGCSCGQVALQRAGIKINKYFASEIDKHAISVTMSNFPNTIQIGDVTQVKGSDLPEIHLLVGGSPCQGFSFAGKQLNFEDPRSKLFFEYVRILDEVKPRFFLLENVLMKKEFQDVISEILLVEPIMINSNLVSAQNRKRLYWTNILGMEQPKDRGILMKDIVHEYNDELYAEDEYLIDPEKVLSGCEIRETEKDQVTTINPRFDNGKQTYQQQRVYETDGKFPAISAELNGRFNIVKLNDFIVPFDKTLRILDKEVQRGKVGFFRTDSQTNRVYCIHDKAVTLTGESGGGAAKKGGQYLIGSANKTYLQYDTCRNSKSASKRVHFLNGKMGTLTTRCDICAKVLFGCITPDRIEKRQNGQRFNDGRKFYTLTAQDQHGILIEGYIRKLTPVECERLQTLPDFYTEAVSKSQRYKILGNGWTVDVIVEFFKKLNVIEL